MASDNLADVKTAERADEVAAVSTYSEIQEKAYESYGPAVWRYDDWMESLMEQTGSAETDRLGSTICSLRHLDLDTDAPPSVTPEMSVGVQRIPPGGHAERHRHNSQATNLVIKGEGYSVIQSPVEDAERQKIEYGQYDTFLVPGWYWHEHFNTGDEDLIIYTLQNRPLLGYLRSLIWQEGDDIPPELSVRMVTE